MNGRIGAVTGMGTVVRPSIAKRGMKMDDALRAKCLCRGNHVDRAFDIGPGVFQPIGRVFVGGRGMNDVGRQKITKRRENGGSICNRALDDSHSGMGARQRVAMAGRKIVDHQDIVAGEEEMLGQIGAEATGAAGNENAHASQPRASFKCV